MLKCMRPPTHPPAQPMPVAGSQEAALANFFLSCWCSTSGTVRTGSSAKRLTPCDLPAGTDAAAAPLVGVWVWVFVFVFGGEFGRGLASASDVSPGVIGCTAERDGLQPMVNTKPTRQAAPRMPASILSLCGYCCRSVTPCRVKGSTPSKAPWRVLVLHARAVHFISVGGTAPAGK